MKNKSIILIYVGVAIAIVGCSEHKDTRREKKPAEAVMKVMEIRKSRISSTVQLPGVMQPFEIVPIFPRVNGFIRQVLVDRGSVVRAGQLLVTLDAPEIIEQAAAAKLKYAQAKADYLTSKDRYERLLETSSTPGAISPFDLSSAADKMAADSAMVAGEFAGYMAQETMKGYLSVTAPFAGVITERNVHPGALVGPSIRDAHPMLVLQQLSRLRLVVDVPEQYAPQVRNGDTVSFRANALPGQVYSGVISRSSMSLSSNYRSETVEIDVANTHEVFQPGMYAEVVLPVNGSGNAFIVPRTAVVTTTERKYVIIANNSIAHWCDVSEGNEKKDSVEVFGALSEGDQIVTNASYQIRDGQVVR